MHSDSTLPIKKKLRAWRESLPEPPDDWPEEITRAVAYMHLELFKESLTVCSQREACRINGKNFSGKFSYYMGHSPKGYIQMLRIEAACHVMKEAGTHNLPLMTLALSIGFSGHSAFTHAFKKQKGVTPSKFMKGIEKQKKGGVVHKIQVIFQASVCAAFLFEVTFNHLTGGNYEINV